MTTETKTHLERQVAGLAQELSSLDKMDWDGYGIEDEDDKTTWEWLSHQLDIEYVVNGQGTCVGGRVLVTFGGPNIWINTRTNLIEAYWGNEQVFQSYHDGIDLETALCELFNSRGGYF